MATVWTTMEKTENGRYLESGFHTTEPKKWYRCFTVEDAEEFISHMHRFNSIPKKPLARGEYEEICLKYAVKPMQDADLDIYGTTSSTRGTSNYHFHTDAQNRDFAIANAIHERRYKGVRKEQI